MLINNLVDLVEPVNAAVGSNAGTLAMTSDLDTMNRIVLNDLNSRLKFLVVTLDEHFAGRVPV